MQFYQIFFIISIEASSECENSKVLYFETDKVIYTIMHTNYQGLFREDWETNQVVSF